MHTFVYDRSERPVSISGGASGSFAYDAHGRPGAGNAGLFQYTGQIWLNEAGVYHYKNRAYHPGLMRFLQTDPIGHAGGINLYAYVGGDSVNLTDPLGLSPEGPNPGEIRPIFGRKARQGPNPYGCPFHYNCDSRAMTQFFTSVIGLQFFSQSLGWGQERIVRTYPSLGRLIGILRYNANGYQRVMSRETRELVFGNCSGARASLQNAREDEQYYANRSMLLFAAGFPGLFVPPTSIGTRS